MILEYMPSAEEFYKTYWNKKPFLVRAGIEPSVFDDCVDPDSLAGLAFEEDIKSRIITTLPKGGAWACEHGPFEENRFETVGESHWSLLVQNVEQYYTGTAGLLKYFRFAPRWLMDDIMVSYSTRGGSVGPHTDSYHVFLVQGQGKRQWRVSDAPVLNAEYIQGQDLKVLKDGFDGISVETQIGDVLYIPPHYAHEGTTIESALTFSVGFLGPKTSELLMEYGRYLEDQEQRDVRYCGEGLDARSSGFQMTQDAQSIVQHNLSTAIQSDDFSRWLAAYFSDPTHADVDDIEPREDQMSAQDIHAALSEGGVLHKTEHVKLVATISKAGEFNLAVLGAVIPISKAERALVDWLNDNVIISLSDLEGLGDVDTQMTVVAALYSVGALSFA